MAKFRKNDSQKSRVDLIPARALELVGHVLGDGARKYSASNWMICPESRRFIAAAQRHVLAHLRGEVSDPDSGRLHLAHAASSLLIALDLWVAIGQTRSMEKRFDYIAVVYRGRVVRRFRSYEKAWAWQQVQALNPAQYQIRTVPPSIKVGDKI